jgi:hypothetical protein
MKSLLLSVAVILLLGGGLAAMNSACKSSHQVWCSPLSTIRLHVKPVHG